MTKRQQLLSDLRSVEANVTKKEKDFDTKTHLIEIFKILSGLFEGKEDVSKEDIVDVAKKESRKRGIEDKYDNWNEIFSLEEKVVQGVKKQEQQSEINPDENTPDLQGIAPLSSKHYPDNFFEESTQNNFKIVKCDTVGDGNCFFHAVFGESSSGVYRADKAQEMRQEWCKFLSQFKSLDDPKMPYALGQKLSSIFYDVFPGKESDFNTNTLYREYLNKINQQGYFVRVDEISILASLADIKIEAYYKNNNGQIIYLEPLESCALNPKIINKDYQRSSVWSGKEQETIYLEGNHYSRAKTKEVQEQEDFLLAKQLQLDEILEYCNISKDSPKKEEVEKTFNGLLEKNADGKISDVVEQCVSNIKQCIQRSEEQSPSNPSCGMKETRVEKFDQQQTLRPVKSC
ncbi:MAG: hypothetical protein LBJ80_04025 [Rickettsiales bacterium]|jgi:hypothetical protein|nr:hypothetical protein [Rickettsiales bacterium]